MLQQALMRRTMTTMTWTMMRIDLTPHLLQLLLRPDAVGLYTP